MASSRKSNNRGKAVFTRLVRLFPPIKSLDLKIIIPNSAKANQRTLIVPDKDADGLSSGVIIHRTLTKLGLDESLLDVHLVQKGSNIHEEVERRAMLEKKPGFVIVLDQGSRGGPPVIDDPETRALVIDHHLSDEFPEDATVCMRVTERRAGG